MIDHDDEVDGPMLCETGTLLLSSLLQTAARLLEGFVSMCRMFIGAMKAVSR